MTRRTFLFVDAIPHFGGHEVMLLRWIEDHMDAEVKKTLKEPLSECVADRLTARLSQRLSEQQA